MVPWEGRPVYIGTGRDSFPSFLKWVQKVLLTPSNLPPPVSMNDVAHMI